jgi:hypothetical protein
MSHLATVALKITTNNQPRKWLCRSDVPDEILADEFDWLDQDNDYGFIRYRGTWYHVSQFMRFGYPQTGITEHGYHACLSESMSTGLMIKLVDDDQVVIASYS